MIRPPPEPATEEQFWDLFVRREDGCLVWPRARTSMHYGAVRWKERIWRTHRLAWTLANGPIPDGMLVCHRCDVTECGEPTHLFLGTQADNIARARAKARKRQDRRALQEARLKRLVGWFPNRPKGGA